VLRRRKVAQKIADLLDPGCARDGVGGATQDGRVVDLDGGGIDFGEEAGEVVGVVVEWLMAVRVWRECEKGGGRGYVPLW
jgi:hypothetical protein